MQANIFIKQVQDHFPTALPDPSRLFEGVRVESGHEKLECLQSIEWPELSLEEMDFVAGEYWQLSNVWTKYYLPAVMLLTAKTELELNDHYELKDELDALTAVCFIYWFSLQYLQDKRFNFSKNIFSGLTSAQISIVEYWLNNIEFKVLDKAMELPDGFDYSDEAIKAITDKMRKFAIS